MKLNIVLSGTHHSIVMLHLTRPAVKLLQDEHPNDWQSRLALLAVGPERKRGLPAFFQRGGYRPKVNIIRQGMHLQAKHFGMEAQVDGLEEFPEQVDSEQTVVPLGQLVQEFDENDFLGVFQVQSDASTTYSWTLDAPFDGRHISLQLENLQQIFGGGERFDLIRGMTYAGNQPMERKVDRLGKPYMHKPVFRVANKS
jgi:hypothetical protein